MKKLLTLGLAVTIMLSVSVMTGCGKKDGNSGDLTIIENVDDDGKVYTPTFMYFVSEADAEYDKEMTLVEELKAKYSDKVKFDIHNIDETPEDKENFPVDGMTPALIMLDTKNNISAMEFMCADIEKLKTAIDAALATE